MATNTLTYNLHEEAQQAMHIATQIAKDMAHPKLMPGHLLKAVVHKSLPLRAKLQSIDVDVYYLEDWADIRMEEYAKSSMLANITYDKSIDTLMNECDQNKHLFNAESILLDNILYVLALPGVIYSHEQLKTFPISSAQLLLLNNQNKSKKNAHPQQNFNNNHATSGHLQYAINIKNAEPNTEGTYFGRDEEVRKLLEIISRKNKANAIIVGEAGVGKSTMLTCIAQAFEAKLTPHFLQEYELYKILTNKLIAGTTYASETEDRLQKTLESLPPSNVVLLIDDIDILFNRQQKNTGITSILKDVMAMGNISIIATTQHDNYRKQIESETSINRNFEKLILEAPNTQVATTMLEYELPKYEAFHEIKIPVTILPTIVQLSERYLYERSLPDSAIDLLDRSMAVYKIMKSTTQEHLHHFKTILENTAIDDHALNILYQEIQHRFTPTLWTRINEAENFQHLKAPEDKQKHIAQLLQDIEVICTEGFSEINAQDINAVISQITGIPIGKVQANEQERLQNMEQILGDRVIGQSIAIKAVADAVLESRSGLIKEGQPIASFFFLGPTGTGKTELAKALANFLFEDEKNIIRFDMSEFKEEHSAALLYGAPPGYVGYEEGGLLVNKIRQHPYAIVLFDEIEKAHPSVFDTFLQILDEGKLTDKLGNVGNFSNAVILFTSNIGAEFIIKSFEEHKVPEQDQLMEKMTGYFRPEFLARITEIVPFAPISEENVLKIFDIHTKPLIKQLAQQNIKFRINDDAKSWLAMQGFSPRYGVRPLKNIIRSGIRKPLSKLIVSQKLLPFHEVVGTLSNSETTQSITWEIHAI